RATPAGPRAAPWSRRATAGGTSTATARPSSPLTAPGLSHQRYDRAKGVGNFGRIPVGRVPADVEVPGKPTGRDAAQLLRDMARRSEQAELFAELRGQVEGHPATSPLDGELPVLGMDDVRVEPAHVDLIRNADAGLLEDRLVVDHIGRGDGTNVLHRIGVALA